VLDSAPLFLDETSAIVRRLVEAGRDQITSNDPQRLAPIIAAIVEPAGLQQTLCKSEVR
jgi:hypothetical protein